MLKLTKKADEYASVRGSHPVINAVMICILVVFFALIVGMLYVAFTDNGSHKPSIEEYVTQMNKHRADTGALGAHMSGCGR